MPGERVGRRVGAFAPGRVNLIGEHTDYNEGLALPFAIAAGITVRATATAASPTAISSTAASSTAASSTAASSAAASSTAGATAAATADRRIRARALDLGEEDEFALNDPPRAGGWRAFVRGVVAELGDAGYPLVGAELELGGDLALGAGLSSSAALEVALCLALLALSGVEDTDRTELARLCARVERDWVGAQTGLLDQLTSLYGAPETALLIDFQTLALEPVPLALKGGWRLVLLDSGERHANASSAYNVRRAECAKACELLGVRSLREASWDAPERLPEPLQRRARHVLGENDRVRDTAGALRAGEPAAVGPLLNESHASLRDQYEVSTPAVERAVAEMLGAGAAGARIVGGGFGGQVLGLFAPGVGAPANAREVRASAGAHLLDDGEAARH